MWIIPWISQMPLCWWRLRRSRRTASLRLTDRTLRPIEYGVGIVWPLFRYCFDRMLDDINPLSHASRQCRALLVPVRDALVGMRHAQHRGFIKWLADDLQPDG